jgi:hypothetical protein
MAALSIRAKPLGIAAVAALPCSDIHAFQLMQLFVGQDTGSRQFLDGRSCGVVRRVVDRGGAVMQFS